MNNGIVPGQYGGQPWGGQPQQQPQGHPQQQPQHQSQMNAFQQQQMMMMRQQQQQHGDQQMMPGMGGGAVPGQMGQHGHAAALAANNPAHAAAMMMNQGMPMAGQQATAVGGMGQFSGMQQQLQQQQQQQQQAQQQQPGAGSQGQGGQLGQMMGGQTTAHQAAAGGQHAPGQPGQGGYNAQAQQQQQAQAALYWNALQASGMGGSQQQQPGQPQQPGQQAQQAQQQQHGQQPQSGQQAQHHQQAQQHGMAGAAPGMAGAGGMSSHHPQQRHHQQQHQQQPHGVLQQQHQQRANQGSSSSAQPPQGQPPPQPHAPQEGGANSSAADPSAGCAAPQDSQTQLLLQQQNLIAQLQRQLQQQQRQPQQPSQPSMAQQPQHQGQQPNLLQVGQQQQGGMGGNQSQQMPGGGSSNTNPLQQQQQQQQQFGNNSMTSPSLTTPSPSIMTGRVSQPPQQQQQHHPPQNNQLNHFPPAMQSLMAQQQQQRPGSTSAANSFGLKMGGPGGRQSSLGRQQQMQHAAQLQQQQHQARQLQQQGMPGQTNLPGSNFQNVFGNNSNTAGGQRQHNTQGGHGHGKGQLQSQNSRSSHTPSINDGTTPLMGPQAGGGGATKLNSSSAPAPSQASPRAGSRQGGGSAGNAAAAAQAKAAAAAMQQNPQQAVMDAMRRATSSGVGRSSAQPPPPGTGNNANTPQVVAQVHHQAQAKQAAQAQDAQQKQQHQLLMAHMLQQQMGGGGGGGATTNSAPTTASTVAAAGGGNAAAVSDSNAAPGGDSTQGVMLEQRVKQFQVMQHLQQLQQQKQVGNTAPVVSVGAGGKNNGQNPLAQARGQSQAQGGRNGSPGVPRVVGGGDKNKKGNDGSAATTTGAKKGKGKAAATGRGAKTQTTRRGSQGSLSQESFSQGSLSQGSLGIVDPDPIAEGVNTSAPLGVGSSGGNSGDGEGGGGGKNQQSFLDGHFAGGWQSNADLPDRRRINFHIIKVIERMRPDANRMSQNRLPLMAKKLEEHLYRSAHTKDEYVDPASLKRRLHLIAKGVGIPKPGEGGDDAASTGGGSSAGGGEDGLSASQHSTNTNGPAVPMEAVSDPSGTNAQASINNAAQAQQPKPPQQVNLTQANPVAQNQQQQLLLLQQQQRLQQQQQMPPAQEANGAKNLLQQRRQQANDSPASLPQDLIGAASQDANGNPRSEKKKVILLQQQRRLLLLRHASKCDGGTACRTKFCPQMVTLWKHMKKCRDKHCKVSHCLSSRCVLNHYRICKSEGKTASCAICAPVMKHIRQNGDGNGSSSPGDTGDDLDTLSDGLDSSDPLDGTAMIGGPNCDVDGVNMIGGQVGGVAQLTGMEPMDAFTMEERAGSTSLSPNPAGIPQAIGLPQAPAQQEQQQQLPNNNGMQQAQAVAAAAAMGMAGMPGMPPQGQQPPMNSNASVPELQQELQKKQLLLQQVQQQKANLYGQSQKLQQQLMSASNPQQAQQLQKQQTILQQLNQQFEQQQTILQGEIQRQVFLLQQASQRQGNGKINSVKPSSVPTPPALTPAATAKASTQKSPKRSADGISKTNGTNGQKELDSPERPSKMRKVGNDSPSTPPNVGGDNADAKMSEGETDAAGNSPGSVVPNKKSPDGGSSSTSDNKGSSLIPSMPVPAIEQHLVSLVSSGQLTPRYIARKCLPLVKKLINHDSGWVFKDAVDPVELGIPEYFDIVEHPMDLTLVANKLEDGAYKDVSSFERDTKLVFENAILFNGMDSDVGGMAKELLDIFAKDLKNALKGLKIDKEPQKKKGNTCSLCGNYRRLFDPPALFCSGACGMQKIRRNATYYTDRFKQNHWCERCFDKHLKEGKPIQLDDGRETKKSLLLKLRNDSTPEEAWVQCDQCHDWNHQICALFNGKQDPKSSSFTCPKCYIKEANATGGTPLCGTVKGAKELPHCKLSQSIEDGLLKTLSKAYEKVAGDRGCTVSQVEKAEDLSVRVVSSLEKKHKVRDEMLLRYTKKGYPSEFKVTTKCIVLFQKVHGVDVLLFGMYVYEYGDDCPEPNRRRVYISYLDSVRYLEPSSYRTVTYQCVITEYLRFVKMRGFHTAHIWSCPPAKGDEYIFHCHPNHQLTPNDDLLCAWYVDILTKAKDEGIILETRTIYDEYFKNNAMNPDTGDMYDPTNLPYFDGDYIPGEIEKIIKDVNLEESQREDTKLKAPIKGQNKQGKRAGTRSNPGELVNQGRDKVMNRLDLVLSRMKKNFMVAQLLSDDFVNAVEKGEDVSSWTDSTSKQKGKNPNLLHEPGFDKMTDTPKESSDNSTKATNWKIVGDTKDHDPVMEQDCIDTRLQFLNYCQKHNYQFDELRRAKHTSMMLLAYLHSPRAEQEAQIKAHLHIVTHAATCLGPPGCSSSNCQRMKQLFGHIKCCDVTYKRGCKICLRLFGLLTRHARDCSSDGCPIPYCDRIKERTHMLLKQQQMMDDRRRDAQNNRCRQEMAPG